ncbi:hypothetical protein RJT34_29614 [Clitoria ternatea]|uniref:Uncharacterized protein n=1 Tax=Clitoria ternatea TaxID=43366 RepID=A0AAN9ERY8_CLITE
MILDSINNLMEIKTAPRSLKHGATHVVPVVHKVWVEREGLGGVKPPVAGGDAENMTDGVELPQTNNKLPDNGVEAGAEATAGDNSSANIGRVKENVFTGTSAVVCEAWGGRGVVSDLAEYDIVLCEVEGVEFECVEVWVLIQWVVAGFEVRGILGYLWQFLQVYGFEQVCYV